MYKAISNLIKNNEKTVYRWKKEKRPIIFLFEKYFTKDELQEFVESGKIQRFERNEFIYKEIIHLNFDKYISAFKKKSLQKTDSYFVIFYFNFLIELKKAAKNDKDVCDQTIFNSYFYTHNFHLLLNMFWACSEYKYIISIMVPTNKLSPSLSLQHLQSLKSLNYRTLFLSNARHVQMYADIFSNWDNYMSIFLKECVDLDLKILYKKSRDTEELNESMYHILGFYVFSNFSNNNDKEKMKKLNNLFMIYKNLPDDEKQQDADIILKKILELDI